MKTLADRDNWDFKPDDINVWDNFFTNECLKILKHRVLYAKHFDLEYKNYYAIDYFKNDDIPILYKICINKLKIISKLELGWHHKI